MHIFTASNIIVPEGLCWQDIWHDIFPQCCRHTLMIYIIVNKPQRSMQSFRFHAVNSCHIVGMCECCQQSPFTLSLLNKYYAGIFTAVNPSSSFSLHQPHEYYTHAKPAASCTLAAIFSLSYIRSHM